MAYRDRSKTLRFGVFEFDAESGELRKQGLRIKIGDREVQVLVALLESPGQMVTRQDLQQRLWPEDTFVEFDNGLNNAISRLRSALGDAPESPRFIETVPRRGYRFLAPVAHGGEAAQRRGSLLRNRLFKIAVAAMALGAAGLVLRSLATRPDRIESLAILPFSPGTGAQVTATDDLASAVTDAIILNLTKTRALRVVPLETLARYAHSIRPPVEIARDLHVDAIATGAVIPAENNLQVNVQIVRAADGTSLWTGSFQRQTSDFMNLTHDLTLGILNGAGIRLSQKQQEELALQPRVNPDAYEDYLKGRYYLSQLTEASRSKALSYFEQAVATAPGFAEGYAGLAYYYDFTEAVPPSVALPKAKLYALRALGINGELPSAHTALAVASFYGDWDWAASEKEFRRSLKLDPGSERAHRMYAAMLSCEGRTQDALTQIHQAYELAPLFLPVYDMSAMIWFNAHQYHQSIQQANQLLELDPKSIAGHWDLGSAYLFQGESDEAVREFEKVGDDGGNGAFQRALLGSAYARGAKRALAEHQLHKLQTLGEREYVPQLYFAVLYASLGANAKALDSLERGYREHDAYLVFIKVTPWLESLHQEPRFQQLIRQMHFPG
jgi:DNA-binding winged helix-turn-helix (wHTH) protein/TolB-like protein